MNTANFLLIKNKNTIYNLKQYKKHNEFESVYISKFINN